MAQGSDHPAGLSRDAIEAQVERLAASPQLAASKRLVAFLRFVVSETVAGRADTLKEYTIALAVYGRPIDFDPKADSIVRTEAHRLRARLEAYYAGAGAADARPHRGASRELRALVRRPPRPGRESRERRRDR